MIPTKIIPLIVATIAILNRGTTYGFPLLPIIDDISQELEITNAHGIHGEMKHAYSPQTHMPYPYYQLILAESQLAQLAELVKDEEVPLEQEEALEPLPPRIEDPSKVIVQGSILDEYDYEDEEFLEDLEMVESNWKIRHTENHTEETGDKV